MRREHDRDRQLEQRPQSFDDLLPRNAVLEHLSWDFEEPRPKSTSVSPVTIAR
jgi:hypothetical protein